MTKEELIDKIKKLLALSDSSNPHEAAAALARAQKLMEKYNIESKEINADNGIDEIKLKTLSSISTQLIMSKLLNIIRKAFGVEPILHTNNSRVTNISLIGPADILESCEYIFTVLSRQAAFAIGEYTKMMDGEIYLETARNASFMCELQTKTPSFYNTVYGSQLTNLSCIMNEISMNNDAVFRNRTYKILGEKFKKLRNLGYLRVSVGFERGLKRIFTSIAKEKKQGFIQGYFNSISEKICEYAQPFEIQENIDKYISDKHPDLSEVRRHSVYNTFAAYQAYQKGVSEGNKVSLNSAIKDYAPKMDAIGMK
ncbi:MAG: DUF2786 domain-containing protein [Succinivibrio sp.]|uniref:Uncharacterized protein n=2 Tax=Succinivibrio dextrinosolvens TaxID=83771 RepID=A0A662ZB74_9GAMM|nr:DUF2786 domain-containing protein [Succinivibrio dextrinosolvens]MBQ3883713.1 DUF2786 domain-containing protein [Succinivibrio sp.]SFK29896.1 Protein of unknown function [Succinivibrio dextrinosolvens]